MDLPLLEGENQLVSFLLERTVLPWDRVLFTYSSLVESRTACNEGKVHVPPPCRVGL